MASERVTRILCAKSPFTVEQIAAMSDREGWGWIYAYAKPKKDKLSQVCFTGFGAAEKAELTAAALAVQLEVVGSVTKGLAFLCAGPSAGPAKLEKAREQGNTVLSREQFMSLVETGELVMPSGKPLNG